MINHPPTGDPTKSQLTPTNHTLEFKSHSQRELLTIPKVTKPEEKLKNSVTNPLTSNFHPNSLETQKESTFLTQSPTKPEPMATLLTEVSKSEEPLSTETKTSFCKEKTQ